MMNIGDKLVYSDSGIVTSVGWVTSNETVYVLEGNINSTGKTIEWLVQTNYISNPKESGILASQIRDNGEYILFLPLLVLAHHTGMIQQRNYYRTYIRY